MPAAADGPETQRSPSAGRADSSETRAAFARSVAFWVRAYPRRWRAVRGAELTAVLEDLAGPGATRLDAGAAIELVRAGWATRWREHPPLGVWLSYRLFDRRIPARYRRWARDEIEGSLYAARRALQMVAVLAVLVAILPGIAGGRFVAFYAIAMLALSPAFGRKWRGEAVRRHLALRPGDVVTEGDLVDGLGPRRRLAARDALTATLVVVAVAAAAWTVAALVGPTVLVGVPCAESPADGVRWCTEFDNRAVGDDRWVRLGLLLAALVAGVALAVLVRRRLRTLIPVCPPQPHRMLVGSSAMSVVVAFAVVAILAEAWLEATGRWTITFATVGGPLALLVLPGVVVAHRLVRALPGGVELAGVDVRTMAVRGRAPRVDELRRDLVPVTGPVPLGATIPVPPRGSLDLRFPAGQIGAPDRNPYRPKGRW